MGCVNKKCPIESNKQSLKQSSKSLDKSTLKGVDHNSKINLSKLNTAVIDLDNIIQQNRTIVSASYKIISFLGQGSYGTVHKVLHKESGIIRAMKTIKKVYTKFQDDEKLFLKEIEVLKKLSHPHIIKIIEYFSDSLNYYLILEYLPNGELSKVIRESEGMNEILAATIMKQLFSAITYLHNYGDKPIVHRDIKAENILVESFDEKDLSNISIKLTDFGTANYFTKENNFHLKVGSPYYIAPEVLLNNYDEKCDLWSCGILMYYLLLGKMPFDGESLDELKDNILSGMYDSTSKEFRSISIEAQILIRNLLTYTNKNRISARGALESDWIKSFADKNIDKDVAKDNTFAKYLKRMKRFKSGDKLHLSALAFLVHFTEKTDEMICLVNIFKALDTNGDGRLTYPELKQGMSSIKGKIITEQELENIFQIMDHDRNGFIEYEEFMRVCIDQNDLFSEKNLRLAFRNFDRENRGYLSVNEFKTFLGSQNNEYCEKLIKNIDKNGDGKISYEEYAIMMKTMMIDKTLQTVISGDKSALNSDVSYRNANSRGGVSISSLKESNHVKESILSPIRDEEKTKSFIVEMKRDNENENSMIIESAGLKKKVSSKLQKFY